MSRLPHGWPCRRAPACALLLLTALLLLPAMASAEYGPAALLSGTPTMQFDDAGSPAFSEDGRYVVFAGSLGGVPGVYRRDIGGGEVEMVAGAAAEGASAAEKLVSAPDASAPSISAEGRYVAFTSAAVLDPQDEGPDMQDGGGCSQVYVRDMSLKPTQPGAFTLVSAVNGNSEGLSYEKPCPAVGGAVAAAGVAISADGRKVVFTVLSHSDLVGGEREHLSTEVSQVAVRDLTTQTTTLVSATPAGAPTPGGGAYPSSASAPILGFPGSSAAISADGSSVAWEGTNIPAQVPSATEEVEGGMSRAGGAAFEVEPLWRRVADGPAAATIRLLAGTDLNFYGFGVTNLGEGHPSVGGGALALERQAEYIPPVLSADGSTVATLANDFTPANEGSYRFVHGDLAPPAEAYAIKVTDDPASPPQVTPLTATPDYAAPEALYQNVSDVAISPDGSRVAFNTRRVSFALVVPTLISPPATEGVDAYTYVANIKLGTMQRVTSTYEGGVPNGEPSQLSFSGDGLSLAFASAASNLFYGDAMPGSSQVYLSQETPPASQVAPQSESPTPLEPLPTPIRVLSAKAVPQADGSVLIEAYVPSTGELAVRASAQLPGAAPKVAGTKGKGRRTKGKRVVSGRPKDAKVAQVKGRLVKVRGSKVSGSVRVTTRTVAQTTALADGASELLLHVHVSAPYSALVASKQGLYCVLDITFSTPGLATLSQEIPVSLRQIEHEQASGVSREKKVPPKKTARKRAGAKRKSGAAK